MELQPTVELFDYFYKIVYQCLSRKLVSNVKYHKLKILTASLTIKIL